MSKEVNYYFEVTFTDGSVETVTATQHQETETHHVFTFRDGNTQSYEKTKVASVRSTGFEPFFIQ